MLKIFIVFYGQIHMLKILFNFSLGYIYIHLRLSSLLSVKCLQQNKIIKCQFGRLMKTDIFMKIETMIPPFFFLLMKQIIFVTLTNPKNLTRTYKVINPNEFFYLKIIWFHNTFFFFFLKSGFIVSRFQSTCTYIEI